MKCANDECVSRKPQCPECMEMCKDGECSSQNFTMCRQCGCPISKMTSFLRNQSFGDIRPRSSALADLGACPVHAP